MASQEPCIHAYDAALTTEEQMQSFLDCTNDVDDASTGANVVNHNVKPKLFSYDGVCDCGDDLLADVRLACVHVDDPKPNRFKSHRALIRYVIPVN